MIRTLKKCQTEDRLHTSGVLSTTRPGPVVYATLRPPATICITLRVKNASFTVHRHSTTLKDSITRSLQGRIG